MQIHLEPISPEVRKPLIDIFNYYVENSFAAYPETKLPYEAFDIFLKMSNGYPALSAKDENGNLLGFGMLRAYNPIPAFSKTAEITCFIKEGYTKKGIGSSILERLMSDAKRRGISCILASISSLNEQSIKFHKKNGFVECGRFEKIGRKNGASFDVVWMQKML